MYSVKRRWEIGRRAARGSVARCGAAGRRSSSPRRAPPPRRTAAGRSRSAWAAPAGRAATPPAAASAPARSAASAALCSGPTLRRSETTTRTVLSAPSLERTLPQPRVRWASKTSLCSRAMRFSVSPPPSHVYPAPRPPLSPPSVLGNDGDLAPILQIALRAAACGVSRSACCSCRIWWPQLSAQARRPRLWISKRLGRGSGRGCDRTMSRSRRLRRRCPHPSRRGSGPGAAAASRRWAASGELAEAVWEGMRASRAGKVPSLVLWLCPRRTGRPGSGLVVEAFAQVFRHKARAPIWRSPPHCMSATMKENYVNTKCI